MSTPRRHGNTWGSAELRALQDEWSAGVSTTHMAENHQRTEVAICCQLDKMGIDGLAGQQNRTDKITGTQGEAKMAQAIVLETRTYLNGRNITDYSSAQIYQMIQETETYLASLDKIQHKPKSLQVEIEKGNAAIVALINYLDSQV